MSIPVKPSIETVTFHFELKHLRAAADELQKLAATRGQFLHFERLSAMIHGPLGKAEKLLAEARTMVPNLVDDEASAEPNFTRAAIAKLAEAQDIVTDDPEINDLAERCQRAIEEAEANAASAQSHADKDNWDLAYKRIREAARFDESPEAQKACKLITDAYKVHHKDTAQFRKFKTIAIVMGVVVALAAIGALIYGITQRDEVEKEKARHRQMNAAATAKTTAPGPAPVVDGTAEASDNPPKPGPASNPPAAAKPPEPLEKIVTLNANEESGTSLGALAANTQITLHYQSGTWCAWARPTGFSPDQPSEGGNVNRVAIMGVQGDAFKLLALVSYKTRETPFNFTIPEAYDKIVLRINDEPGSFEANVGSVVYRVLIAPPKEN